MATAHLTRFSIARAAAISGTALAVALFAGCGGGSDSDSGAAPRAITASTDGAEIYKAASCGGCHTLAAAGSEGRIGPNLDEEKPSAAAAVETVTSGDGTMPAFKGRLSPEQIQAVSDYVAQVAGR